MGRIRIKNEDILYAVANDQIINAGAMEVENESSVYFITAIFGTSITLKNVDGDTIITGVGGQNLHFPYLRLDGGFNITGTNLTVVFAEIRF